MTQSEAKAIVLGKYPLAICKKTGLAYELFNMKPRIVLGIKCGLIGESLGFWYNEFGCWFHAAQKILNEQKEIK
jgi:hypothetical protein